MSASRIMAANRLASDGLSWSRLLDRQNSGTSSRQWINLEPRLGLVSLVEQIPGFTQHADYTSNFRTTGYLGLTGVPRSPTIRELLNLKEDDVHLGARAEKLALLQANVTTIRELEDLVSGKVAALRGEEIEGRPQLPISEEDTKTEQLLAYRGDLAAIPRPLGVIDSKLFLFRADGLEGFEAKAGPVRRTDAPAFDWAKSFPNSSHLGQPESFAFDPVAPKWIWN